MLKVKFKRMSMYFFVLTIFLLLLDKGIVDGQIISDKLCPSNQYVRTYGQPNKELFTILHDFTDAHIPATLEVTANGTQCLVTITISEWEGLICEIENTTETCKMFGITECRLVDTTNVTSTITATNVINDFYQGTNLSSSSAISPQSETMLITGCKVESTNEYLKMTPSKPTYGEVEVQCINESQLVQGDHLSTDSSTNLTCGQCGLFEPREPFYCVIAIFTGATVYKENDASSFSCFFNENAVLSGKPPNYYLNGKDITDEADDKIITAFDHMSTIRCSMFLNNSIQTEIYSDTQVIQVKYQPYNTHISVVPTNLYHNTTNGILLNESQTLDLSCVADANPTVDCIWNNTQTNISNICITSLYFDKSSNISCTAYNDYGSLTSSTTEITIVGSRNAKITEVPNILLEGDTLELSCILPYAKELETLFKWNIPTTINTIELESPTIQITSVTKFHNGVYKCETNDVFGNYSSQIDVNVLYRPYDVTLTPLTSDGIVQSGSNLLLNSTENVFLNCTSDANPAANCTFQINETTDILDGSCGLEKEFNQSANVTCTARNEISSTSSKTLYVAVVQPRNEVDGDLSPTYSQPIEEEDLVLDCSIPYQEELGTTFSWTIPSDRDLDKTSSIVQLNDLSRFDLGNYTCTTIDTFGRSSRTKFLDVFYSPQEVGGQTTCHFNDIINGSCHVNFTSNPKAEHYVVQREGQNEPCPTCSLQPIDGDIYKQQFILLLENAPEQTTFYQVHILSSNNLLQNLTVEFNVTVGDVINPPANQTGLIVGCVVGGVALIILVVGIIMYLMRKNGNKTQKETTNSSQNSVIDTTDNYSRDELGNQGESPPKTTKKEKKKKTKAKSPKTDVYAAVDFSKKKTKDSEKEERLNPLYDGVDIPDQITDAYDTVDVNKTQNEKEDRLNPLYDVGQGNGVEEAYASVDKTKKKKKEKGSSNKEDRINPLYAIGAGSGMQDTYAEVDFDKKKKNKKNKKSTKCGTENKVTEGQDAGNDDVAEATYATVNKTKRMKKQNKVEDYSDAHSSKSKKPPQTFKVMDNVVGDTYAVVKKDNTKVKGEKEEIENLLYDSYLDQPTTSGCHLDSLHASYTTTALDEATYAVVDKSRKSAHSKPESIKPTLPKKPDQQQSFENYKPKIGKKPSSQ